jgi:hypothetical protein
MAMNTDIEKQVEETLGLAKCINAVDVPDGFTDRTMQRISVAKTGSSFSATTFLKLAAVFVLICVNIYTIRYVITQPEPQQNVTMSAATMDDLVNDYQVTDISNEWLNNKLVPNEQP